MDEKEQREKATSPKFGALIFQTYLVFTSYSKSLMKIASPKRTSTLRLCSDYTGSIFGSVRYNMNNAQENRTVSDRSGEVLFTLYRIDMLHIRFSLAKKPNLESRRVMTRFRSQNGADLLDSPFTLGAGRQARKLSDT